MRVAWIWFVALAISALPVGWVAWRSARALFAGALILAFVLLFWLGGLGLGGAGAGARDHLVGPLVLWVAALAAVVVLLVFTFARMTGSPVERIKWTMISVGVWIFVWTMMARASGQVSDLRRDADLQAFLKRQAQHEADVPQRRTALDRTPERRRALLDSMIARVRQEAIQNFRPVDRFVVFGDPATAPDHVVVWAVVTPTGKETLVAYSLYGERLQQRLNALLRERGYPANIALGFAVSAAIDSAGGDEAYFGRDGSAVIPQYPPDNVIGDRPRRLDPPRRKG